MSVWFPDRLLRKSLNSRYSCRKSLACGKSRAYFTAETPPLFFKPKLIGARSHFRELYVTSVLQGVADAVQGQRVIEVEEHRFGFGIDLDEGIAGQTIAGF
jgi:hypothetical protein